MADGTVVSKNEVHIVLAGKSGAGKSTVAKNIFGMQTEIKLSPDSVTEEYTTEEIAEEKHGIKVWITDTPGLKQKGKKKELKKLSKHIKENTDKEVDLLVYCLSIDPSCKFADGNPTVMRGLQEAFGKEIWERCVLIFTFSNRVWEWHEKKYQEDNVEKYKEFIELYAAKFRDELKNMNVMDISVEAVLDFKLEPVQDGQTIIPAIPAGDEEEDNVLPSLERKTISYVDQHNVDIKTNVDINNWKDIIFLEIAKKCNAEVQKNLLQYRFWGDRFNVLENASGGTAAGAAGGAAIGAIVGFATGPIGPIAAPIISAIGAAIGAVAVGMAGGVTGGGITAKTVLTD